MDNQQSAKKLVNILIFSILAFLPVAVFVANYALIFHFKALFISFLAIGISIYGLILRFMGLQSDINGLNSSDSYKNSNFLKGTLLVWIGVAIYSLSAPFMLLTVLASSFIYQRQKFVVSENSEEKLSKSQMLIDVNYWIFAATSFIYADQLREWSVWNRINFTNTSIVLLVFVGILGVVKLINVSSRKKK
jgi:hypothetical protein